MALIGLLLLAAAAVFGIGIAADNTAAIELDGFGQVVTTSPAAVLAAGAVCGLVAAISIMLMRDGLVRRRRLRAERRAAFAERDRLIAAADEEHIVGPRDVDIRDRDREPVSDRDHVSTF